MSYPFVILEPSALKSRLTRSKRIFSSDDVEGGRGGRRCNKGERFVTATTSSCLYEDLC